LSDLGFICAQVPGCVLHLGDPETAPSAYPSLFYLPERSSRSVRVLATTRSDTIARFWHCPVRKRDELEQLPSASRLGERPIIGCQAQQRLSLTCITRNTSARRLWTRPMVFNLVLNHRWSGWPCDTVAREPRLTGECRFWDRPMRRCRCLRV
jgi:hypothetical protein